MTAGIEALALAFALTMSLLGPLRRMARSLGWYDRPNGRKGSPGYRRIPRIGGVAIFLGVGFGLLLTWRATPGEGPWISAVAIDAGILFAIGLVDDVRGASAAVKLVLTALVGLLAFHQGIGIVHLPGAPGIVLPKLLSLGATVLWMVGVPCAINFIDGLDGLAAGLGVIAAAVLGIAAWAAGDAAQCFVCCALAGALTGFFLHNRHPARIFMGDGGALFVGAMLAVVSMRVLEHKSGSSGSLAVVAALAVPLFDLVAAVRRRVQRRNLLASDGDHVHHVLARAHGHEAAVTALHLCALAAALVGTSAIVAGAYTALLVATALGLVLFVSARARHVALALTVTATMASIRTLVGVRPTRDLRTSSAQADSVDRQ